MEVKLATGIKSGHKYGKIFIDGQELSAYIASRRLTNTDNESGSGIFSKNETNFIKGDMSRLFVFEPIKYEFATPEYVESLRERIAEVREWVKSLDYERTISFSIEP
jgi:hypothetical protein